MSQKQSEVVSDQDRVNLQELIKSFDQNEPQEANEVKLISEFISNHANSYAKLESTTLVSLYEDLLRKILANRINNAHWQYKQASGQHLLRVLQCVRILQRARKLSEIFVDENGLQYLCQKLHEVSANQNYQAKTPLHARHPSEASNNTASSKIQYQRTKHQLLQQKHSDLTQQSANDQIADQHTNQEGSNLIHELDEESCELLTEILSILYKTVSRLEKSPEKADLIYDYVFNETTLNDLQLLLSVRHNVLLRCVFECILTLFEWLETQRSSPSCPVDHNNENVSGAEKDKMANLSIYFANPFTVDMLLQIVEGFSDEFRKLAAETLTYMLKNESLVHTMDILRLFKSLGGCEKTVALLMTTDNKQVRARLLQVLQTITSGDDMDVLQDLQDFNAVSILLQLLIQVNLSTTGQPTVDDMQNAPAIMGSVLTILTNLALNDSINVKIRLHGAHIIGAILMENCPALAKSLGSEKLYVQGDAGSNTKIQHELQLHCLRCLRFLYSVEKNRKAFKVVFPPSIFGAFIDVGNYNKDFQSYIPLLKKLNKKTSEESLKEIRENFINMGNFQKLAVQQKDKYINGFKIVDLIGKGAYGSVYLVQRGENSYAMKEIPLSHFDVTPEKFESYLATQNEAKGETKKSVDDVIVEEICKEVSILKDLNHPNIIRYYNSFADACNVYIIMELLDGYSLGDYILSQSEKKHRVKEEVVWTIFVQLCAALRYLHVDKRIVHRDLAPGNVLIDENFNLKLADFGLAKRWGTQSASVMKSFVGTILYSCPEIVQSQPYTEKADIWSLGCIIYELMTFNQPFSAGNPLTIANKIVDGEYEPINEEHYSADLIYCVKACMTADPKKRASINDLCQLMSPVVMDQLDSLRTHAQTSQSEIKQLKDKLKNSEQINTTQFGFGNAAATMTQGGFKFGRKADQTVTGTTAYGVVGLRDTGGFQAAGAFGATYQNNDSDMRPVQVNSDQLKKLSADPVAKFLDTVNQLEFIVTLPPSIDKDIRQIQIEAFHRAVFNKQSSGVFIKNEILKLQNCSRDLLQVACSNSSLKKMTYEALNQVMEDLLREKGFQSQ